MKSFRISLLQCVSRKMVGCGSPERYWEVRELRLRWENGTFDRRFCQDQPYDGEFVKKRSSQRANGERPGRTVSYMSSRHERCLNPALNHKFNLLVKSFGDQLDQSAARVVCHCFAHEEVLDACTSSPIFLFKLLMSPCTSSKNTLRVCSRIVG